MYDGYDERCEGNFDPFKLVRCEPRRAPTKTISIGFPPIWLTSSPIVRSSYVCITLHPSYSYSPHRSRPQRAGVGRSDPTDHRISAIYPIASRSTKPPRTAHRTITSNTPLCSDETKRNDTSSATCRHSQRPTAWHQEVEVSPCSSCRPWTWNNPTDRASPMATTHRRNHKGKHKHRPKGTPKDTPNPMQAVPVPATTRTAHHHR